MKSSLQSYFQVGTKHCFVRLLKQISRPIVDLKMTVIKIFFYILKSTMLDKKKSLKIGKRAFYYFVLMSVSSLVIYFVLLVQAGSLNPASPVASTMRSMDEIYLILSGTHDSSGVSSKSDGNVSEVLKCVTDKLNGRTCD